jgi:DNA mismatch repair protein MutL
MAIIVLDKDTAEQIAAGEVIENPASVVKELVENSLDAGASSILISIEEGGKKFISVTDNGRGLPQSDLSLAFTRFATSKLTSFEDLDRLNSLGFRGEALPSIAAVSRVTMTSRVENNLAGTFISLAGSKITDNGETGAPFGTMVEVKDLFYNTPGRLKFLRSANYETSRISNLLTETALANPAVAFELKSSGRLLFRSPGDGNLLHAINALYGDDTAESMIPVDKVDKQTGCKVQGYTSAPHMTRSSRKWITTVINGRLIKNDTLVNALERAYGDYLPSKRHPLAVLLLSLPPETLDVNVHPAKTEIRFQQPEHSKNLVFKAVKLALQTSTGAASWPASFKETSTANNLSPRLQDKKQEELFSAPAFNFEKYTDSNRIPEKEQFFIETALRNSNYESASGGECRLIGQYLNSYLVAQKGEDLILIDQHAAHERIIYNRLLEEKAESRTEHGSQLIIPLTLKLPAVWQNKIERVLPLLKILGFEIDSLGEDSYAVRAVPFMLRDNADSENIFDMLEKISNLDPDSEDEQLTLTRDIVYKTIACHRSVKARQKLSHSEMEHLLREWENNSRALYCPHGRPTTILFKRDRLEKSFHRGGDSS